jgi:xylulokinase
MTADNSHYILAIDLGTSGPKVALFTTRGEAVDYTYEPTELLLFPDGGAEQSPDGWWEAITKAARRLLEKGTVPADRVVAVSTTAQWSGTVPVDAEGRHLCNGIIWMDSRGLPQVKKMAGGPVTFEGYSIPKLVRWVRLTAGCPGNSGKDPIAHILWLKHEKPDLYRRTYKFLEPKDYLNLRLTGKFCASYDSITLHWVTDNRNLARVVYDDRLLEISTLDREKLPELKRAVDVLGTLTPQAATDLGLGPDVKVMMGTPDVMSAAIGSGAVRDYEGHLYIGTSSWITCHVPFKKTDVLHNMATLPSAIPERYLIGNEQETAGGCLNYLRDFVFFNKDALSPDGPPPDVFRSFDAMASRIPAGSDQLIFLPWLYGERTPVEDRYVRGGFLNQSLRTTREHMIRAVFEGVAYNARWLLNCVENFIKRPFASLNMIGGGAKSDVWCQIFADVFDRPIRQVKDPILSNARGAAYLASLGLGYMTVEDIPRHIQIARTYTPNPENRKIYDELFGEFLKVYKTNKKTFARLNRSR